MQAVSASREQESSVLCQSEFTNLDAFVVNKLKFHNMNVRTVSELLGNPFLDRSLIANAANHGVIRILG